MRITGLVIVLIGIVLLTACVDEADLDLPEDQIEVETSKSLSIVSLLNYIKDQSAGEHDLCFDFIYPIDLGYNNDIPIKIEDIDGLLEASITQSSGFHIDQIAFPFLVLKGETLSSVENDLDFLELLIACDIPTMKEDFFETYLQCYDFVYPVNMIGSDSSTQLVNNAEELFNFKSSQGEFYQPNFEFPVDVNVFSDSTRTIESHYGFYQLFDVCDRCPDLDFDILEGEKPGRFTFKADPEVVNQVSSYDWFIDGEYIETDGNGVGGDNMFTETFLPGVYEICMKAETPGCPLGVEYCEDLEVDEVCPDLSFSIRQEGDLPLFVFEADFELKEEITYTWKIYRNEELIFSETEIPGEGDNKLIEDFEPGLYIICIEAEVASCLEKLTYCEELLVEERCPELFFEYQVPVDTRAYEFFADFPEKDEIEYTWAIYQSDTLVYFETETPGVGDNLLFFQFDPGEYLVCMETETDRCTEVEKYCEELFVE